MPEAFIRYDWSDERIARVRELAAQGYTASRIAEDIRAPSRNAVLGQCYRRGIALAKSPEKYRTNGAPAPRPSRSALGKRVTLPRVRVAAAKPEPPAPEPPVVIVEAPAPEPIAPRQDGAPTPAAVRFCDSGFNQCRFFLEGQSGFRGWCCGKPWASDRQWFCHEHSRPDPKPARRT